jgi:hypothetical protein
MGNGNNKQQDAPPATMAASREMFQQSNNRQRRPGNPPGNTVNQLNHVSVPNGTKYWATVTNVYQSPSGPVNKTMSNRCVHTYQQCPQRFRQPARSVNKPTAQPVPLFHPMGRWPAAWV